MTDLIQELKDGAGIVEGEADRPANLRRPITLKAIAKDMRSTATLLEIHVERLVREVYAFDDHDPRVCAVVRAANVLAPVVGLEPRPEGVGAGF